jgi:hypothetical protein
MTLRLPTAEFTLSHGGNTVRLRPSLRAAHQLAQKYEVAELFHAIDISYFSRIADIFRAGSADSQAGYEWISIYTGDLGLKALEDLAAPLLRFVLDTFGIDLEASKQSSGGKPAPLIDGIEDLFATATGWLGWTPDQAWAASPAEIMKAHSGLIAKLKAIHGSTEEAQPSYDPREEVSPETIRDGIATLKAISGKAA